MKCIGIGVDIENINRLANAVAVSITQPDPETRLHSATNLAECLQFPALPLVAVVEEINCANCHTSLWRSYPPR